MRWTIRLTVPAKKQLAAVSDQRIRQRIAKSIEDLAQNPEKLGKPLSYELAGCRSIRAVGQRYRIIYKLKEERVLMVVVTIGIRRDGDKKDVYEVAKKLARQGLLDLDDLE